MRRAEQQTYGMKFLTSQVSASYFKCLCRQVITQQHGPILYAAAPEQRRVTSLSYMSDPSDYTISVIVPVHRGEKPFHRCLSSLKALEPAPHEIIVVADGDPESARVAETMGVQVVRTPAAGGPARARNLGAQHARGDILFFIDADVTVSPDAITRLDTLFTQDPNLTAVIGSYDDQPAASNFLSRYKNLMHHYVHQISQETASTFWGACGAIHRDTFLAMSGFDERYRHPPKAGEISAWHPFA